MLLGPDQIIACPKCGKIFRLFALREGTKRGATLWSDGKFEAPDWPKPPFIAKCVDCRDYFWIEDTKKLGEISIEASAGLKYPHDWVMAKNVKELSREELHSAIVQKIWNNETQQFALRLHAWWAANDPARTGKARKFLNNDIENLNKLTDLLRIEDPQHRIYKAEIYRELGGFDSALSLLAFDFDILVNQIVEPIREMCLKKDDGLKVIFSPQDYEEAEPQNVKQEDIDRANRALKAEMVYVRAEALFKKGNFRGAKPLLEEAIRINSEDPEFHFYLGICQYKISQGIDFEEAKNSFAKALELGLTRGKDALSFYLGMIAKSEGRPIAEQRSHFIAAIRENPQNAYAQHELSLLGSKDLEY